MVLSFLVPRSWAAYLGSAIITGLCLLQLHGCSQPIGVSPQVKQRPQIVAMTTILADLTSRIGQEEISVVSLLKPGDDPHIYEPVPSDSRQLDQADLILLNGYNLEPALAKLAETSGQSAKQLKVGEVAPPLYLEKAGSRVPDPHVWGDVKNVQKMTLAIRDALIELKPQQRVQFEQNSQQLLADLQQLDAWIGQQIQTIPADQRKLVTTHDAFQYYGRAYGLAIPGTLIGISTEEQPSAKTVKQLVQSIESLGVPAIFAETTINPELITVVAEESGVKLAPQKLYSDSIGPPGSSGDSYLKMMEANTQTITQALGGKASPRH
jgi:manganese/iron transport system substrate-binding protein